MTIAIDENIPLLAEAINNEHNDFQVLRFQGRTLTKEALRDCVALCVRSTTRVDESLLFQTPVRFVGTATSGSEHIDHNFLRTSGILFHDAKGCNADSVAEYVLFAILLWAEKRGFMRDKQALRGKTLGIVGYGHIGQRVARLALKMGLRVIVSDPPFLDAGGEFARGTEAMALQTIAQECDILTNHVPYTLGGNYETVGMFDDGVFKTLRAKSLFIHASRGGIISESALQNAIEERHIFAAVDVWHNEPHINAALAQKCLLATPHIAGYSHQGKINGSQMIARALERFVERVLGKHLSVDWGVFEDALEQAKPRFKHDFTDHRALLEALRESRKFEADSSQLLASLAEPNAGASFDILRKTYPQRHEILFGTE